jgi:hypothetical protein
MADISAIAIRYADEVWNAQNLDAADEIFTPDHVYHDALLPDLPKGPEGVRQRRGIYLAAIPDARVTLHRVLTQGEHVAADWTYTGTNTVRSWECRRPARRAQSGVRTSSASRVTASPRLGRTRTTSGCFSSSDS